jgi:hypothetical protein
MGESMINRKNLVYIALSMSVLAYAMDIPNSLLNIREDMRNLHAGVRLQDVQIAGHAAISLLGRADTLKLLTLQDIEGASAPTGQVPSPFIRSFFYDLIVIGQGQLLDIFLEMLYRSYGPVGINWLSRDSAGNDYTMLDKAYRLRRALIAAGNATEHIDQVIEVLIEHGGELYANIPADSASPQVHGTGSTQSEQF